MEPVVGIVKSIYIDVGIIMHTVAENVCSVKNMITGEQVKLSAVEAAAHIKATLEAGDCAVILEK